MRRLFAFSALLALLFFAGCGDSHEAVAEESVSVMKEMVATLEGITDAASARAAKSKLQSLAEKMKALEKRMAELGTPTEDQINAMEGSIGQEMEAVQTKLTEQMMRLAFDMEIQKELSDLDLR